MKDNDKKGTLVKIRLHYIFTLVLIIHSVIFLVYWFAIGSVRGDIDEYIANFLGYSLPYSSILIIMTACFGLWSLLRFLYLRYALKKDSRKPEHVHWVYTLFSFLFLILFYFSFFLILRENPAQKGLLYQLFDLIRVAVDPLLFLTAAIWLRKLILFFRKKASMDQRPWIWKIGIGLVLLSLVGLWLLPAVLPSNWAYQGDLPAKPALIAHRGASMLAPENTMAAADLAAKNDAFGFETDLRISLDGMPFLMHDQTLQRTTNISEIFPAKAEDDASNFTMGELSDLNAGLWFIQKDPYGTIEAGLVSQAQLSINQGQKIPTLMQALEFVKEEEMVILFDLRYPPEGHPYHDQFFDVVFDQCKEVGLNGNLWFLVDEENIDKLLAEAPQMTRVIGILSQDLPDPETLLEMEYEIVNVDTGILLENIQAYRQKGLGVNVYTIDQPWLFSQFWLSGVTSVTTNNIHTLHTLDRPILNLPYSRFLLYWGLLGIVVAIWLASSQPRMRKNLEVPEVISAPNIMDFAMEEEQNEGEHDLIAVGDAFDLGSQDNRDINGNSEPAQSKYNVSNE